MEELRQRSKVEADAERPFASLLQRSADIGRVGSRPEVVPTDAKQSGNPHSVFNPRRLLLQALLPAAILAAAVGTYRYLVATKPETPKQAVQPVVFTVTAMPVSIETVQPRLTLYGTTVAGRQIEIRALVAGRVVEAGPGLRAGGEVKTGDTLLVIDRFDYQIAVQEADAQVAEARAKLSEHEALLGLDAANLKFLKDQLRIAEADLDRAEPLSRTGAVTQRTVDDRRLVVSQRQQAVVQLENNLTLIETRIAQQKAAIVRLVSAVERARQRLVETRLIAPFNGYVADVGAQIGRMLNVNDRVATLFDRDWIEVRFSLSDRQFGRMIAAAGRLEGRKITASWNVSADPPTYTATIERVAARVSADSGGVEVFARVDAPHRPIPLRPGAFVEIKVPDVTFTDVVRLPASAVYDGRVAYVAIDGKLVARDVRIVGTDGDALLVRGDLAAGERVVATRLSTPGTGVRVREN